jgi:hypothetical protein
MSEPRSTITRLAEGGAIGGGLAVVKGTAENQAKLPAAAGARALGVTFAGGDAAGRPVTIVVLGDIKAVAKSAIATGDPVDVADTAGKFRKAAPAAGANAELVGYALSPATNDGDQFDLLVTPSSLQTAD